MANPAMHRSGRSWQAFMLAICAGAVLGMASCGASGSAQVDPPEDPVILRGIPVGLTVQPPPGAVLPVRMSIATAPLHGVAEMYGGPGFRYTSWNGYAGPDSVGIAITDAVGAEFLTTIPLTIRENLQDTIGLVTGVNTSFGRYGDEFPIQHALSGDGRYLAVQSRVGSIAGTGSARCVYRLDRYTGMAIEAPLHVEGGILWPNGKIDISSDGSRIVFSASSPVNGHATLGIYLWTVGSSDLLAISPDAGSYNDPVISGDGAYIGFMAYSSTLLPGLIGKPTQILRYCIADGTFSLASISATGDPADGECGSPAISDDGQRIAFTSRAANLDPLPVNDVANVFLRDCVAWTTTLVSKDASGTTLLSYANGVALSGDGSHLVYTCGTPAFMLVADPTRSSTAYTVDLATGAGVELELPAALVINAFGAVAMDEDGSSIVAMAAASSFSYGTAVVRFMGGGSVGEVMTYSGNGTDADPGMLRLDEPVSMDGSGLVLSHGFLFLAHHVRVLDHAVAEIPLGIDSGITPDMPVESMSGPYEDPPAFAADGMSLVFAGSARNLAAVNPYTSSNVFRAAADTYRCEVVNRLSDGTTPSNSSSGSPDVSGDGNQVVFAATLFGYVGATQIYLRDVAAGTTIRISETSSGTPADGDCFSPKISADGRYCVFTSLATNLAPGAPYQTLMLWERGVSGVRPLALDLGGHAAAGFLFDLSDDGRFVVFGSDNANLVPGDGNGNPDLFLVEVATGTITCLDRLPSGDLAGWSGIGSAKLSADGRLCVFATQSGEFAADDTNGLSDVYRVDTATGTMVRVSTSSSGLGGNAASWMPTISADGRMVAFLSEASNLFSGDEVGTIDVVVKDMDTGAVICANADDAGLRPSFSDFTGLRPTYGVPTISPDGTTVVFSTDATGLLPECRRSQNLMWKRIVPLGTH
jgi:Tol biopolymer transport system component